MFGCFCCRGRFSEVHACTCRESGRAAAVKCIDRTLTDEARAGYELNVMRSLEHTALLPVLGAYSTPRAWLIVMPRVQHGPLFQYVCQHAEYDESQCARFIRQLLDALQYLHLCRVIHLDVKVSTCR